MVIGPSCLVLECLCEAINVRGIGTDRHRLEQQLAPSAFNYDVLVFFMVRCEPSALELAKRRLDELGANKQGSTVALFEDPQAEAAAFCGMGFSTVVLGLPSLSFAVDVVQLMLGPRRETICNRAEDVACRIGEGPERASVSCDVSFTARELKLVDLLRRGMQNKLIAYQLGISESTVKAHLRSIMMKLKASNRTQAVSILNQSGVPGMGALVHGTEGQLVDRSGIVTLRRI
jgi:DNA-binding CsgD family transcriptional regulator